MSTKQISISEIILDDEIMPRDQIDPDYVDELFEDIERGDKLPPPDLFEVEKKQYLAADGYHRLRAAIKAGHKKVDAVVHKGTRRDAMLFSSSANANHGKRRTNEDKRKAVKKLFMDSECWDWTDVLIADHCKVTSSFVGKLRKDPTLNGLMSPSVRVDANGRKINVANIGRGKSLEHVSGMPHIGKVPLPVPNSAKPGSTTPGSETKTNPPAKQELKTKKSRPKTWKVSNAENSEIRRQIEQAIAKLHKLDEILEANKTWTKDKAKKFMKASEDTQLHFIGIKRFAHDLISKFD